MLKSIKTLIRRLVTKDAPNPVGRWRVEECNIKLNSKIDLSNEDHCGPCGQYAMEKKIVKEPTHLEEPSNFQSRLLRPVHLEGLPHYFH